MPAGSVEMACVEMRRVPMPGTKVRRAEMARPAAPAMAATAADKGMAATTATPTAAVTAAASTAVTAATTSASASASTPTPMPSQGRNGRAQRQDDCAQAHGQAQNGEISIDQTHDGYP